jgi:hypothetical protein
MNICNSYSTMFEIIFFHSFIHMIITKLKKTKNKNANDNDNNNNNNDNDHDNDDDDDDDDNDNDTILSISIYVTNFATFLLFYDDQKAIHYTYLFIILTFLYM